MWWPQLVSLVAVSSGFVAPLASLRVAPARRATELVDFESAEAAALKSCADGDYATALELFEKALKLPGDGYDVRRVSMTSSPVNGATVPRNLEEVRFPSKSQQQTTYYNMACVFAKLEKEVEAVENLEKALAVGFDDYDLILNEADFGPIAADAARLVEKYRPKGFFETFFKMK